MVLHNSNDAIENVKSTKRARQHTGKNILTIIVIVLGCSLQFVLVLLLRQHHPAVEEGYEYYYDGYRQTIRDLEDRRRSSSEGGRIKKKHYNFTVGICALTKDHEAYMTEWLDYHLLAMEMDQIILLDNSRDFELERWYNNTRNHSVYSRVQVHHHPGRGWLDDRDDYVQGAANTDCIEEYGEELDYIALIDADEFLVPQQYPSPHSNIKDILLEYLVPFGGALTANWMLVGTSNKTVYAPIPVLKRFQYVEESPNTVIKTIVKSSDYDYSRNPHGVALKHNRTVRTTKYPGAIHKEQYGPTGASDHEAPSKVLLVYHVRYFSSKEYMLKRCSRGEADGTFRGCNKEKGELASAEEIKQRKKPDHIALRPGSIHDDTAWKILTSKVPKYRIYDTKDWQDFT